VLVQSLHGIMTVVLVQYIHGLMTGIFRGGVGAIPSWPHDWYFRGVLVQSLHGLMIGVLVQSLHGLMTGISGVCWYNPFMAS